MSRRVPSFFGVFMRFLSHHPYRWSLWFGILALWSCAEPNVSDECTGVGCPNNACEGVDFQTSQDHCGRCHHACDANSTCEAGNCVCREGWIDCDADGVCEREGSSCETDDCEGIDLQTSAQNCGACHNACPDHSVCLNGECQCASPYNDCDGNGVCETLGSCLCTPGETKSCYDGPDGTENVGECHSGYRTCKANDRYGAYWDLECVDQVTPQYHYFCDASRPELDLDCNGIPEIEQDDDGDGFPICKDGEIYDCCDNSYMCPSIVETTLKLINPGMLDCHGNDIDDNCNDLIDEDKTTICGETEAKVCPLNASTCGVENVYQHPGCERKLEQFFPRDEATLLAKAMDMCFETVEENSNQPGIIEAYLQIPGNNSEVYAQQVNVMSGLNDKTGKTLISPKAGKTFVLLSSGYASDAQHIASSKKVLYETKGVIPSVYGRAHHWSLKTHEQCDVEGVNIFDAVQLHFKLRAPDTAQGLKFDFRFFTNEYPTFVCSKFNDFFLALLTDESGNPLIDIDGDGSVEDEDANISFDDYQNPITVNSAFFNACYPIRCTENHSCQQHNLTCDLETDRCNACPDGTDELYAFTQFPKTAQDDGFGGATSWLTTQAPIKPGSVFNLDFYIWDTGDSNYDSTVILDNFQWLCDETSVMTYAQSIEIIN